MNKTEKPLRVPDVQAKKTRGEKITMLTAYSTWLARLLSESAAIDMLLVGDSVGMVELGYENTIPVTVDDMVHHTRAVRRGAPNALIVADMPFLSYQASRSRAVRNAGRLLQKGLATAVKVEGGCAIAETVTAMVSAGIPVMGHLGLTPQSIHLLGGFRRQAKRPHEQRKLLEDAEILEGAGAFAVVLECVPDQVGKEVSERLKIPVIGIGSGPDCDGQVLVSHDMLGLTGGFVPAFAKQYVQLGEAIKSAAKLFSDEVLSGQFPPSSGE
jgi:3-methyl-2-oxobutanoate hydroxymethyltransferase